ncbi:hypothetical protein SNE35_09795 [Paucibacter sp. R3-3]|uniref:Uncharacterized protein n=1 Tax=Roseateles agri TaxID=3098619 RepID=A0ABU5DET5_9BURK|nr:hypothetical protein [Paucibacter sp. R3-3]MDY0744801.1 hypothetical protein [Paucibacter sp. R3-3]
MSQTSTHPSSTDAPADNGILAKVPGQYVGQACVALPDPVTFAAEEVTAEVDAG